MCSTNKIIKKVEINLFLVPIQLLRLRWPRIQISSEFPGIPAIPLLSSILRRIPFLLYGGIYRKVTEVTERNAKVPLFNLAPTRHFHLTPAQQIQPWPPTTNLTPSRPSKPSVFQHCQLSALTWEMTRNTLTTAKQSGLMVLLRLYSWRNSFPPKNTVTFLRPDDANVRLLSFNIPRNSPEFPSLKEFPYFCPLSEGSSEKEFGS